MTDTRNNTFISSFINDDFEVLNGSGLTLDESILDEMESKLIIDCNEDNILTSKSDNIIIINSTIENGRDTSKDKNAKTDTAGNDGFRDLDIPNGFNNPTNTMNIHEHGAVSSYIYIFIKLVFIYIVFHVQQSEESFLVQ
ncbi:hypothetical protein WA158_003218 [Blastocystis sp. Blastoise]